MKVIVDVDGGQGFLPDNIKGRPILMQAFAQNIIDRYCNTEYFDPECLEELERENENQEKNGE